MTQPKTRFELDTVFIHTTLLKKSIRFYSLLLGCAVVPGAYDGPVYVFGLHNDIRLLLDDHRLDLHHYNAKPLFMLRTNDLESAFRYVQEKKLEVITPIVRGVQMRFFIFADPDMNTITVSDCKLPYPMITSEEAQGSEQNSLREIFVRVRNLQQACELYSSMLQVPYISLKEESNVHRFRVSNGVGISLCRSITEQPNPSIVIETNRLHEMRSILLRENGVTMLTSDLTQIDFLDFDGNRIRILERK